MTCFRSEYAKVCYKVGYVEVYPKEDYANDDIFHP